MSPPFDFLERTFLPLLARMGAEVEAKLERPGFYPAGGGVISVRITPWAERRPLVLIASMAPLGIRARAVVAHLSPSIAERELTVVQRRLGVASAEIIELERSLGPGNVLTVEVESEQLHEVFTGFGEKARTAEAVAEGVCREVTAYLAARVAVGPHLADQLLLPLALAGSGAFRTCTWSDHAQTQVETMAMFLATAVAVSEDAPDNFLITVG